MCGLIQDKPHGTESTARERDRERQRERERESTDSIYVQKLDTPHLFILVMDCFGVCVLITFVMLEMVVLECSH